MSAQKWQYAFGLELLTNMAAGGLVIAAAVLLFGSWVSEKFFNEPLFPDRCSTEPWRPSWRMSSSTICTPSGRISPS